MAARWVRLNTDWSASEWLAELDPAGRLAWVELLCYVKAHGTAGAVKRISPAVAARLFGVTRNDVTDMEEAAKADDALRIEDGDWIVSGWGEHQMDSTAAERQRRYRERQKQDTPPESERDVTRNDRNVTRTETETKEETSKPDPVSDLWPVFLEELGGTGRTPALTDKRKAKLRKLYDEQLKNSDDPVASFRKILAAVKASDFHMQKREWQMPESLFQSQEHRENWAEKGLSTNGVGWLDEIPDA